MMIIMTMINTTVTTTIRITAKDPCLGLQALTKGIYKDTNTQLPSIHNPDFLFCFGPARNPTSPLKSHQARFMSLMQEMKTIIHIFLLAFSNNCGNPLKSKSLLTHTHNTDVEKERINSVCLSVSSFEIFHYPHSSHFRPTPLASFLVTANHHLSYKTASQVLFHQPMTACLFRSSSQWQRRMTQWAWQTGWDSPDGTFFCWIHVGGERAAEGLGEGVLVLQRANHPV